MRLVIAMFLALLATPAFAAPAPATPDFRAMAMIMRTQRNEAQQQAADLAAELQLQQQQAAKAEANWREYSRPLWDKTKPPPIPPPPKTAK